jgi:hypothetical protein
LTITCIILYVYDTQQGCLTSKLFGNRKFNSMFTRSRHWSLSQARLIQSTPSLRASLRPVQVLNHITYTPPKIIGPRYVRLGIIMLSSWFSGPRPNSQACPPFVDCLLLLIQYIRSYSPQQEAVCSIRKPTSRQVMVTRNPINMADNRKKPIHANCRKKVGVKRCSNK